MPQATPCLPQPSDILLGLQDALPGAELHPSSDPRQWELRHSEQPIRLRWHDQPARLELAVDIGVLPPEAGESTCRSLLSYNGLSGSTHGMRVVLEGPEHRLVLICDQPAGQCSPAELEQAMLNLVDSAYSVHIWLQVKLDSLSEHADASAAIH